MVTVPDRKYHSARHSRTHPQRTPYAHLTGPQQAHEQDSIRSKGRMAAAAQEEDEEGEDYDDEDEDEEGGGRRFNRLRL